MNIWLYALAVAAAATLLGADSRAEERAPEGSVTTAAGAAATPSAEEIAAKLANPNTPLASLTTKLQYRTFEGDLAGAGRQDGTTLLLQPSFPFALKNGDLILFRPAIPILLDQPVVDSSGFGSESGLGDITGSFTWFALGIKTLCRQYSDRKLETAFFS